MLRQVHRVPTTSPFLDLKAGRIAARCRRGCRTLHHELRCLYNTRAGASLPPLFSVSPALWILIRSTSMIIKFVDIARVCSTASDTQHAVLPDAREDPLGFGLTFLRVSRSPLLRGITSATSDHGGTPLLLQLLLLLRAHLHPRHRLLPHDGSHDAAVSRSRSTTQPTSRNLPQRTVDHRAGDNTRLHARFLKSQILCTSSTRSSALR